ncbi:MAG TPA: hypothetical protein PLY93_07740 [Turneriella sp.]|nr:hypothetical protein [Turneriella sp.]
MVERRSKTLQEIENLSSPSSLADSVRLGLARYLNREAIKMVHQIIT